MSFIHRVMLSSVSSTLFTQLPNCEIGLGVSACIRVLVSLRSEFEPRRAQLFARGRVPISEVLSELRAEESPP
jgi:hypothetical protein